jgi:RNA polymerase sigma factor (sigma-70 family)
VQLSAECRAEEFTTIAEQHRAQFLWLARSIVGCEHEAEDVVQAALLKAFSHLHGFRDQSAMKTWLWAIVRNTARDRLRRKKIKSFVSLDHDPGEGSDFPRNICDKASTLEDRCQHHELMEIVFREMQQMDPFSRNVIEMCVLNEQPQATVAEFLHTTVPTIKSCIFRAKKQFAEVLTTPQWHPAKAALAHGNRATPRHA